MSHGRGTPVGFWGSGFRVVPRKGGRTWICRDMYQDNGSNAKPMVPTCAESSEPAPTSPVVIAG